MRTFLMGNVGFEEKKAWEWFQEEMEKIRISRESKEEA